jgi:hypothetical protein
MREHLFLLKEERLFTEESYANLLDTVDRVAERE